MAQRRDLAAQNAKKDKLIKESDENARKQVDQVSTNTNYNIARVLALYKSY